MTDNEAFEIDPQDDQQFKQVFGFKPPRSAGDIRKFIDEIAQQFPDLWKFYYPRWYSNTDRYLSAKTVAQCFFMVSLDVLHVLPTEPSLTETSIFVTALKLSQHRFPHFFIGPELFKAVSLSEPPPGMKWTDMHLPHDASIFMLPRKSLYHPTDGEVSWLAYSRVRRNEPLDFRVGKYRWERDSGNEAFAVCWECHEHRPNPSSFHMVLAADANPTMDMTDIEACFDEKKGAMTPKNDPSWLALPMAENEQQFSMQATSLVFRLLLALEARPQLERKGKFTGKRLCSAHQPEIWTPNTVGFDYVVKRPAGITHGGGWTVRMHWKRGHYKQQPHGPQHTLRKTIWIEPYLVGVEGREA